MADITTSGGVVTDWTAVAQNTLVHSTELDISADLEASLMFQAGLGSTTAHTGTKIIVEVSQNISGDEDWAKLTQRVILTGTANAENITDSPLVVGSTTLAVASTTGYTTNGELRMIVDSTLANSEIVRQIAYTTDTSVTILDGTTNEHAQNTTMYSIAISEVIAHLSAAVRRVRVLIDNTYDSDGSALNYRLLTSRATDIE